jgi:hypothetical protein
LTLCLNNITAYVDTGGYNVFTVDWSHIAEDIIYSTPAILTLSVGKLIAEFFERLIAHTGTHPSDIHLIGHSLGAHVMGSCGSNFKSEKIGRITGEQIGCIPLNNDRAIYYCNRKFDTDSKIEVNIIQRLNNNRLKKKKPKPSLCLEINIL